MCNIAILLRLFFAKSISYHKPILSTQYLHIYIFQIFFIVESNLKKKKKNEKYEAKD